MVNKCTCWGSLACFPVLSLQKVLKLLHMRAKVRLLLISQGSDTWPLICSRAESTLANIVLWVVVANLSCFILAVCLYFCKRPIKNGLGLSKERAHAVGSREPVLRTSYREIGLCGTFYPEYIPQARIPNPTKLFPAKAFALNAAASTWDNEKQVGPLQEESPGRKQASYAPCSGVDRLVYTVPTQALPKLFSVLACDSLPMVLYCRLGILERLIGDGEDEGRTVVTAGCTQAREAFPHATGTAAVAAANVDWPLTHWIALELAERKALSQSGTMRKRFSPLILGISGPQGCGKTTLCAALIAGLKVLNIKAEAASMDDFYLPTMLLPPITFNDFSSPRPRILPRRGPPGTHDLPLCLSVLQRIKRGETAVNLPRYDKSKRGGAGDRDTKGIILDASGIEVFILEGWMLG
ncbi:uncharacterized protein LOC113147554 [Cyclospora cayetanensis]|uniref:Uncharacterized protein LOC113147554 n=1 Tax=Cyclospora cayetanensis TaxID=88456 RepID=A0A6P6S4P4_9EIME|nr:uncharacterized protein LOC113147554 [Cyclospora cayetanensis]